MDGGDPSVPPKFSCEQCGGEMYPEYYKGVHEYEYSVSDIHQTQKYRQANFPDGFSYHDLRSSSQ